MSARPDGFTVYEHDTDRDHYLPDVDSLIWWLGEHEPKHRGLTALQEQLLDGLASPAALERLWENS